MVLGGGSQKGYLAVVSGLLRTSPLNAGTNLKASYGSFSFAWESIWVYWAGVTGNPSCQWYLAPGILIPGTLTNEKVAGVFKLLNSLSSGFTK